MRGNPLTVKSKLEIRELYLLSKCSIPEISDKIKISRSTIRFFLKRENIIRDKKESIKLALARGRIPSRKGIPKGPLNDEWKNNMSKSALARGEKYAKGFSLKPSGYYEITRGENKGRHIHIVVMENKIGRRLFHNECVHHIDQCKTNNDLSNLQLMTKSEHGKLHRELDKINNINQNRSKNGRFC